VRWAWLLLGVLGTAFAAEPPLLQPLIDATPPGGVLKLGAGTWRGPARISRPITLDGQGQAQLVGDGRGTVLEIDTDTPRCAACTCGAAVIRTTAPMPACCCRAAATSCWTTSSATCCSAST
jgi:nitrous oxidase accessory protein NosD